MDLPTYPFCLSLYSRGLIQGHWCVLPVTTVLLLSYSVLLMENHSLWLASLLLCIYN